MPSKLTPETQERICQLLRAGNTHETSAEAAGITASTFYDWKRTKPAFAHAVQQAEAEAEATLVTRIAKAAQAGSWRAACWLLERRNPERWAAGARAGQPLDESELKGFDALDELAPRRNRTQAS